MFFGFKKFWNNTKIFPKENQRIVFITIDGDIYTGNYENKKIEMCEFLGMPFYSWEDVIAWKDITDFKNKIK